MQKICQIKDTDKIQDNLLKRYIMKHIETLCKMYNVSSIAEFGAIYVIENDNDFYTIKGVSNNISDSLFEFVNLIYLTKNRQEEIILLACLVISDDYSIHVVCNKNNVSNEFYEYLMKFYNKDEYYDFSKEITNE